MKTFLFQGDSITDADRRRDDINNFGYGYPNIVAAKYLSEFPNEFTFINKGISGNRIVDLYARIKIDLINLKPDYLSILIGINDVWHELSSENGVDNEKFKKPKKIFAISRNKWYNRENIFLNICKIMDG